MAQNFKRDANGRFVRTTPDWKKIATEYNDAFDRLIEYVIKHRFASKSKILKFAAELLPSKKEIE